VRLDELIKKRFVELEEQATTVRASGESVSYFNADTSETSWETIIPRSAFVGWATSVLSLLQRALGENSVHYKHFADHFNCFKGSESDFETCRAIFSAAKADYEGGYLFNVRALIKAEVLGDALDQAANLLNAGYKDPACVVIGVALEMALKELCTGAGIPHGKIDKMNADLTKADTYNITKQKQITAWADLRNKAAHGDWNAYNPAEVKSFLDGVKQFIEDYLTV